MNNKNFYNLSINEKREALSFLRKQILRRRSLNVGLKNALDVIHPDIQNRYEAFPLTDIQESFLIGKIMNKDYDYVGCHIYNEYEVKDLDVERLNNAWNILLNYHDMLKVIIDTEGTQRIVKKELTYNFQVHDYSEKSFDEINRHINIIREKLSHKVYLPGDWPLFEIAVTICENNRSIIHVSIDEWIVDAASYELLMKQWYKLYCNPDYLLSPLELSFRDFVIRLKKHKQCIKYKKDLDYWMNKLSDMPGGPELLKKEIINKDSSKKYFKRKRIYGTLDQEKWQCLKQQAADLKVSPTVLLLTIFSEIISQFVSNQNFSLILTFFNRVALHPQIDAVVGPFISTNIFIIDNSRVETRKERLLRNQAQLWGDLDHSSISGITALRELKNLKQVNKALTLPFVFTSLISNVKKESNKTTDSFLDKAVFAVTQTPQVYFDHQMYEYNGELKFTWDVAPDFFEDDIIEEIYKRYNKLLSESALDANLWKKKCNDFQLKTGVPEGFKLVSDKENKFKEFPLTDQQEAYFVGRTNLLNNGNRSCQVYLEYEVENLNVIKLETVLNKMILNHEMLRAVIEPSGKQRILEKVNEYKIYVNDLRNISHEAKHQMMTDLKNRLSNTCFELGQWPFFTIIVSLIDDKYTIVHFIIDMMIMDGNSIQLFTNQLFNLYHSKKNKVVDPGISFREYILSVKDFEKSKAYKEGLKYWENKFSNLLPGPELINCNNKVDLESVSKKRLKHTILNWDKIKTRAYELNLSPGMILLAIYCDVLNKWSTSDRFTVVAVNWERLPVHPGISEVLGDFTCLAWPVYQDSPHTFIEKVKILSNQIRKDLSYAPVSGLRVLRKISLKKMGQENISLPIVFTNLDINTFNLPDYIIEKDGLSHTPQVYLDNISHDYGDELHVYWDYAVEIFPRGMIEEMFPLYTALIQSLVTVPKSWKRKSIKDVISSFKAPVIQKVDINTNDDHHRKEIQIILNEWNNTEKKYPQGKCLHEFIEESFEINKDKITLMYEDLQLTNMELNRKSNQCAHFIIKSGAGPDKPVAVIMERSIEMVISLFGVLKSGSCYLPVDPLFPEERINFILKDANISIILTQDKFKDKFTSFKGKVISLESDWEEIDKESHENPDTKVNENNIAYIIYTSGSTGKPKGCMVPHKAICNRLFWMQDEYQLTSKDRILQKTPYTFDVSVWEFFWPLLSGAILVVAKPDVHKDTAQLIDTINKFKVTTCHFVPSMLNLFLHDQNVSTCHTLRQVFASGEALSYSSIDTFLKKLSPVKLHNLYGPTEAAVDVTYWPAHKREDKKVPIGKPISNIKIYILDKDLNQVPVGHEGELHIGGIGLALGYLNRDELTKEKFISDPFSNDPASRLYKTGDKAVFLPDGNIEFRGRIDFQVKVRGLRIELGEIEAVVLEHKDIKEAVVLVRDMEKNNPKIVAYVVTEKNEFLPVKEIKAFLSKSLPEYEVPNVIVALNEIPLSAHGKVNRKALPWPVSGKSIAKKSSKKDMTLDKKEIQTKIHKMVIDLLSLNNLESDEDIFDIGATSLTVVQITQKILKEFNIRLTVNKILDAPTIKELSTVVFDELKQNSEKPAVDNTGNEEQLHIQNKKDSTDNFDIQTSNLIQLPVADSTNTQDYILKQSHKTFLDKMIPFCVFSHLFQLFKQEMIEGKKKFLYASAGGKNAVQIYMYVKKNAIENLQQGVYYYQPLEHALVLISSEIEISDKHHSVFNRRIFNSCGFMIFFIAQNDALRPVYKDATDCLVILDTGYMEQLLLANQKEYSIGFTPISGFDFNSIRKYFKLDDGHKFIHCMAGGFIDNTKNDNLSSENDYQTLIENIQQDGREFTSHLKSKEIVLDIEQLQAISIIKDYKFLTPEEEKELIEKKLHLRKIHKDDHVIKLNCININKERYTIRECKRNYAREPVSIKAFSNFLALLKPHEINGKLKYQYPSIGKSYSVDVYIYVKKRGVEGIEEGLYVYNQVEHSLKRIYGKLSSDIKRLQVPFNRVTCLRSRFVIFFIGRVNEIKPYFGEKSFDYLLLEAGSMSQLLMDNQAKFNLGLCPIGGMNFHKVENDFHFSEESIFLHSIMGGMRDHEEVKVQKEKSKVNNAQKAGSVDDIIKIKSSSIPANVENHSIVRDDLAIIGISGRFPKAVNVDEFWTNLKNGVCSIDRISEQRSKLWEGTPQLKTDLDIYKAAFLDDIECFDSLLFNISPFEAKSMDPQERILLEVVWECLENAGYTAKNLGLGFKKIGVFIGAMWNDYQNNGFADFLNDQSAKVASLHSVIANRISYFFNFDGPSLAIDTSCASALAAIHLACNSIYNKECDIAIACGVNIISNPYHMKYLIDNGFLSDNGKSSSFSAISSGWIPGEGVGSIIIKPFKEAVQDKDIIYGKIKGTAINHTGKTSRFGAPDSGAQEKSILDVLKKNSLPVDSIDYIETAATGSSLADASEFSALGNIFSGKTDQDFKCPIGSVKPNIGHLESASIMAQLFKVLFQLNNRLIAPTLLYEPVNPLIDLKNSPFYIVKELTPWKNKKKKRSPLRALINGFGATGSTAHLVIEGFDQDTKTKEANGSNPALICLSASSEKQLKIYAARFLDFLKKKETLINIHDIAFSLHRGRVEMEYRLAIITSDVNDLIKKLNGFIGDKHSNDIYTGIAEQRNKNTTYQKTDSTEAASKWVTGVTIDWSAFYNGKESCVPLPTYPFVKEKHWLAVNFGFPGFSAVQGGSHIISKNEPSMSISTSSKTTLGTQGKLSDNKSDTNEAFIKTLVEDYLKKTYSKESEIPVNKIKTTIPLENYGISSIIITKMNTVLAGDIDKDISKTLFFEYPTLQKIAEYLTGNYRLQIEELFQDELSSTTGDLNKVVPKQVQYQNKQKEYTQPCPSGNSDPGYIDVAVVGVSGLYPAAETLSEFWEILRKGKDCITEVPVGRWNYSDYLNNKCTFNPEKLSKWGGFIKDVDKFDPLFFNISPREAELMDPEERLFLQVAWHCIEDAGYNLKSLHEEYQGKVGVYVGVIYSEYKFYGALETFSGNNLSLGNSLGSIPNRVSYFMNLTGPSMAIDTICSSSLSCIHIAVESIKRGEVKSAIVGGVNLALHPNKYIGLAQLQMTSTDGKCRSFGAGGNGFVPGEGVGAVFLKPLPDAVRDGNQIYGVIKGTSVNHDGKTNGYTVPNPNAQAELILEAFNKNNIKAETISYVEAHGTGTSLGDPIEITALTKAFGTNTDKKGYCSIGSVKSNIGHLEACAGIAGLTKILLQMRHGKLVPSLNSGVLNPNINFADSPFYVQQKYEDWKQPVIKKPGIEKTIPRRSCISSFGSGGSNAHVIVEEYQGENRFSHEIDNCSCIIILSAKTKNQLKVYAQNLKNYINNNVQELSIRQISYTLQCGREEFEYRLAIIVSEINDLIDKLSAFINGENSIMNVFVSEKKVIKDSDDILLHVTDNNDFIGQFIIQQDLAKIAQLWISGVTINWKLLYPDGTPSRISLPGYPFLKDSYWIPTKDLKKPLNKENNLFHPFIGAFNYDMSFSDKKQLVFSKELSQADMIVSHHKVGKEFILPGVVILEMAFAVLFKIKENEIVNSIQYTIQNFIWCYPVILEEKSKKLFICIEEKTGVLSFEVFSEYKEDKIVHARGTFGSYNNYERGTSKKTTIGPQRMLRSDQYIPVSKYKKALKNELDAEVFYNTFSNNNIEYGDYFKNIKKIWYSKSREAFSYIELSRQYEDEINKYFLHPGLVDSALQTVGGILLDNKKYYGKSMIPFSVGQIRILNPLKSKAYVYASKRDDNKFDIVVADKNGLVSLEITELVLKEKKDPLNNLMFVPFWRKAELSSVPVLPHVNKTILIIYSSSSDNVRGMIKECYRDCKIIDIKLCHETRKNDNGNWEIDANDPFAMKKCIGEILYLDTVYFLGGILKQKFDSQGLDKLITSQESGVLSLFRLVKALIYYKFFDIGLEIKIITNNTSRISLKEKINPYSSSIYGLTMSIVKEYPHIDFSYIDIDVNELKREANGNLPSIIEHIITEPPAKQNQRIMIRNGRRYEQSIKRLILPPAPVTPFKIKGTYFILGGAGGIGLEFGKYLAKNVKANLVLVGRSTLDSNREIRIKEIEKLGSAVLYIKADGNNFKSMQKAVKQARKKFGKINGVIHSAIVLKDNIISNMSEDNFIKALNPKVKACFILNKLFKKENLDFFLVFSSVQSLYPNAGQCNYTAGCSFIDTFVQYLNDENTFPVKIIYWGYWGSVGSVSNEKYKQALHSQGIYSLKPHEGMEAIKRVLSNTSGKVAVIKADDDVLKKMLLTDEQRLEFFAEYIPSLINDIHLDYLKKSMNTGEIVIYDKSGERELEKYGRYVLLNCFVKMGVFNSRSDSFSKEELKSKLKINKEYDRLFDALLDISVNAGFIKIEKDGKMKAVYKSHKAQSHISINTLIEKYPTLSASFRLLNVCIRNLPQVLSGEKSYIDVMFPDGSLELVEGIYKGDKQVDYFNTTVAALFQLYLYRRLEVDNSEKIKILEIGAGTGGTSGVVLKTLNKFRDHIEYYYTDLSASFVSHGEKLFKDTYSFVKFEVLDIEQSPTLQGFAANSFDVVFATNAVHATRNMDVTLLHIKKVLKNNGVLVLNEVTTTKEFLTLTFGLTSGWWRYDDEYRITNSPLLSINSWKEVLDKSGYKNIHVNNYLPKNNKSYQNIILCESNGEVDIEEELYKTASEEDLPDFQDIECRLFEKSQSGINLAEPCSTRLIPDYSFLRCSQPVEDTSTEYDSGTFTGINTNDVQETDIEPAQMIVDYIKGVFSKVLKIDKVKIENKVHFDRYGLDSLTNMEVIQEFEKEFGSISSTLLFEYFTVDSLASYFLSQQTDKVNTVLTKSDVNTQHKNKRKIPVRKEKVSKKVNSTTNSNAKEKRVNVCDAGKVRDKSTFCDIAVIGISGIYPLSDDLDQYWENLCNGVNCIQEIPPERWDLIKYFKNDVVDCIEEGKAYSKWGGFISNVDKFDSQFFKITPKEAEEMDPQERLFLEIVWKTIEDAGYTSLKFEKLENKVGVFAGVMNSHYEFLSGEAFAKGISTGANSNFWSIPNRVSYFFNFNGPSIAIDTACSSSLTAIHLACESLNRNECKAAVAGGVNLILHPMHFIRLSNANMLSPGKYCKVFDNKADGFIDGEGVGAVLLKSLEEAQADNDRIYAVIKGSYINAGGKTTGFTVPNQKSQSNLITTACENAKINPRTITYIEAHGTGTALGDPIEVHGLNQAFNKYSSDKHFCSIGSVKSNIGHLESAAGIAGLTKVLLQLKYKKLLPSINCEILNSKIDFTNSPFYVQKKCTDWKRPVLSLNGNHKEYPRRAGISSFGAGGANAHLIIEEYESTKSHDTVYSGKHIFIFSAKDKECLIEYAKRFSHFLRKINKNQDTEYSALNIAYTLQTGREQMTVRLAIISTTLQELDEKLIKFYKADKLDANMYTGISDGTEFSPPVSDQNLHSLAQAWIKGTKINWDAVYENKGTKPDIVSLPHYVFTRESHWLYSVNNKSPLCNINVYSYVPVISQSSELIKNISTFSEQKFEITLSNKFYCFSDHRINDKNILAGVIYLEIAYYCGLISNEMNRFSIKDIIWRKPLELLGDEKKIYIAFRPSEHNIEYEIYTGDNGIRDVYCSGIMQFDVDSDNSSGSFVIDIEKIKNKCTKLTEQHVIYQEFEKNGRVYGPAFRSIQQIHSNGNEAVVVLNLPETCKPDYKNLLLHPALMDGALQGVSVFNDHTLAGNTGYLPFSLDEVEVYDSPFPEKCYAYIKYIENNNNMHIRKFDIMMCNTEGRILCKMKNFKLKSFYSSNAGNVKTDKDFLSVFTELHNGKITKEKVMKLIKGSGNE